MGSEVKQVKQAEWVKVLRSDIHSPDYNPRKIEKAAAEKLRKQIREDSLVDTLVVNKRTMNIVGGNQRCAQLDAIYKYKPGGSDYEINVQMIDVDERTEIKINARLNNPDAAGVYDAEKLFQVIGEFEMDPLADMNFDRLTFDIFASEAGVEIPGLAGFDPDSPHKALEEKINAIHEATKTPVERNLRELKAAARAEQEEHNEAGTSEYIEKDDYILTIVFNSNQEKHEFLRKIGKPEKERFIKGATLRDVVRPEFL